MGNAKYTVSVEPERDLVRITIGGFFELSDVGSFLEARDAAHEQLRCGPNQHLTLTDVRDVKILPSNVVEGFRLLLANPEAQSRKLAFLVPPTLTRGQLTRAVDQRQARFFTNEAEAERWLFS